MCIKSIDRFTRGGGDYYSPLKRQLTKLGIALEDMYGVIGKQQLTLLSIPGSNITGVSLIQHKNLSIWRLSAPRTRCALRMFI